MEREATRSFVAKVGTLVSVQLALPLAVFVSGWVSMDLASRAWTSFDGTGDLSSLGTQLSSQLPDSSPVLSTLTYVSRISAAQTAASGRSAFELGVLALFLALVALRRPEIPWIVRLSAVVYAIHCIAYPVSPMR
jgi:hypothetical protein